MMINFLSQWFLHHRSSSYNDRYIRNEILVQIIRKPSIINGGFLTVTCAVTDNYFKPVPTF